MTQYKHLDDNLLNKLIVNTVADKLFNSIAIERIYSFSRLEHSFAVTFDGDCFLVASVDIFDIPEYSMQAQLEICKQISDITHAAIKRALSREQAQMKQIEE